MFIVLAEFSALASVIKLLALLLVFFALLYGAHLFTKWYAKSGHVNAKSSNISIIESQQIVPGKSIVIAKVGEKYISFFMSKENATVLTELSEEELKFEQKEIKNISFKDVLKNAKEYSNTKKNGRR